MPPGASAAFGFKCESCGTPVPKGGPRYAAPSLHPDRIRLNAWISTCSAVCLKRAKEREGGAGGSARAGGAGGTAQPALQPSLAQPAQRALPGQVLEAHPRRRVGSASAPAQPAGELAAQLSATPSPLLEKRRFRLSARAVATLARAAPAEIAAHGAAAIVMGGGAGMAQPTPPPHPPVPASAGRSSPMPRAAQALQHCSTLGASASCACGNHGCVLQPSFAQALARAGAPAQHVSPTLDAAPSPANGLSPARSPARAIAALASAAGGAARSALTFVADRFTAVATVAAAHFASPPAHPPQQVEATAPAGAGEDVYQLRDSNHVPTNPTHPTLPIEQMRRAVKETVTKILKGKVPMPLTNGTLNGDPKLFLQSFPNAPFVTLGDPAALALLEKGDGQWTTASAQRALEIFLLSDIEIILFVPEVTHRLVLLEFDQFCCTDTKGLPSSLMLEDYLAAKKLPSSIAEVRALLFLPLCCYTCLRHLLLFAVCCASVLILYALSFPLLFENTHLKKPKLTGPLSIWPLIFL